MYTNVHENALIDGWKKIETKPSEIYKIEIKDNKPMYNRDMNVHRFLLFLKMIPCHKVKFENAANSFMVFSEVTLFEWCSVANIISKTYFMQFL